MLRHNLDVMHIEKNVCDSMIRTLLNIEGKTKDNLDEGIEFCKLLKSVKVLYDYSSNISRCVQLNERKIYGLKSHDYHVLMHQLLPLSIHGVLHKNVSGGIIELCNFFKQLYSKVLSTNQLQRLKNDIIITLCKLERLFPPSFFDIMMHLPMHLENEAKIVGPVQYR